MKNLLRIAVLSILMTSCFGGAQVPSYYAPYGKAYSAMVDEFSPTVSCYDSSFTAFSISYQYNPNRLIWLEGDRNISLGQFAVSFKKHSFGPFFLGSDLRYEQGTYEFNNRLTKNLPTSKYVNLGLSLHAGLNPICIDKGIYLSLMSSRINLDSDFGDYITELNKHDRQFAGLSSDTGMANASSSQQITASFYSELRADLTPRSKFYLRLGYTKRGSASKKAYFISPILPKEDLFATISFQYRQFGIFTTFSHPINRQEVTRPNLGFYWAF